MKDHDVDMIFDWKPLKQLALLKIPITGLNYILLEKKIN